MLFVLNWFLILSCACSAINACVIAFNGNISQQKCPNIEPQKFVLEKLTERNAIPHTRRRFLTFTSTSFFTFTNAISRPFIPRIVHYSQFATQFKGTHARHQTSGKRINFNFDVMLTSFLFPCSNLPLKARARLEMREKASQQDAKDVVEIMKYSLLDTFSDDFGNLDFQRSQHGSGMSSRAQVRLRGEGSVLIVTYPAKSVFNNWQKS